MTTKRLLSRIFNFAFVSGFAAFAGSLAMMGTLTISMPAQAEEDNSIGIEEIVVTARKREEASQDIPIAITALTAELDNASIRSLTDLTGYAPNLIFSEDGSRGGGGANINIRGISPTRTDDNSFDAPIAVVVDDIYLGSLSGQVMENFDLERVEVLRGPQGTLFGKNTVGGVINVVRSRPTGENGARFKVTLGEDGQQEIRAVANTGLTDGLALKVFGTDIQFDGHRSNRTTGNDIAERDYQNLGVALLWEPTDNFEALFTAEIFRDEGTLDAFQTNYNTAPGVIAPPTNPGAETDYSGGFVNCLVFAACRTSLDTPSSSENNVDNEFSLDTDAFSLKMTLDLNENLSLVSITGYRDIEEYRIYDFDASAAPFITIERFNEYDQLSQEFRIDGEYENISFTAGVYYFENEFEQDWITGGGFWNFVFGSFGLGAPSDPAAWGACVAGVLGALACDPAVASVPGIVTQILFETQETTSIAAYGQMDWRIDEKWTVTAGLRWTREEKDFIAGQAYLTNVERQRARAFPLGFADLDNEWTEISPKVGVSYQINDDSLIYASYAEGFHSGGFFGVNQNIADFERDQYEPEIAKTYEVGYKSQHLDNRLRLNLTYFYNDFTDKQESIVALDPSTNTVASQFNNVGSVIYQGWELETQFVFNEYLRMFMNVGYLDAEYDVFDFDVTPNDGIDNVIDATFLTPRNAPETTFSIGGTLSFPIGEGHLEIFSKYTLIDEVQSDLLNIPLAEIEEREDLVASVSYVTQNWSVSAFGRNLTDERFETFVPIATLFAAGNVNRPRTFGVEFTYNLGND